MPSKGTPETPDRYSRLVARVREAALGGPGCTTPSLRSSIAARAAGRSQEPIPAELASFVDTVARHAYRVTGQHVSVLRDAGYSEDEIFEFTVSAALGAGLARLQRGLAALGEK